MKINKEVEKLIFDVATVANSINIDEFVIDEHGIRGTGQDKMVVILNQSFDLEVPFEGLAIADVAQFVQRYNIHNNNNPESISLTLGDDLDTKVVTFNSKNLKIEYRCMKSSRVKAPKKLNDTLLCSFELSDDDIDMLKRGSMTMKADDVLIVKDEDADFVYLELTDVNKSKMKFELEGNLETEDERCMFAHRYPIKPLLMALKDSDDNFVDIGEMASLSVRKQKINIIIQPRL